MRFLAAVLLAAAASSSRAGPLDLPKGSFKVDVAQTIPGPEWTETVLRFPSAVKSPWPANDVVWAHLIVPRSAAGRKVPAILVLPVMAAPNVWIEMHFVDRFARDGFVVMWLEMPTQFHRRPNPTEPSGQVFLARTTRQLTANFRQSVLDARRALGVLAARPEVEPDRIAIFGISLGAIVGSVTYSVDPRPRFAAFLLGGADFPTLLLDSSLSGPFARKMGLKPDELREAWKNMDPYLHPERGAGKPALLVNADWDTVIPRSNAQKLLKAFPDARQVWVPGGHYTSIVHLIWLPGWVSKAMMKALGSPLSSGSVAAPVKKR
ncbi:MAG TPA: dienelactone hydrolase family protein [Elusimicrobiota bacterium]|jgi:dienelactone hydrolase|nr:dienelactone hydrolase family protein [Elusimicrobiota bacterium]